MANDDSEKRASLEKLDVEENVMASEQGHMPSVDTKVLDVARAVSRQSTPNKPELDTEVGVPASGADSGTATEERWLTGRKLILVHTAMLLS